MKVPLHALVTVCVWRKGQCGYSRSESMRVECGCNECLYDLVISLGGAQWTIYVYVYMF